MRSIDDLPPAFPSMWRALKRGYQAEPLLLSVLVRINFARRGSGRASGAVVQISRERSAGRAAQAHLRRGARAGRVRRRHMVFPRHPRPDFPAVSRPGDHRARIARGASTGGYCLDRTPRTPRYLDRLAVLRNQVFVLDHMYMSLFTTCGWILSSGRHPRVAHVGESRAGVPGRVCVAHGADVILASECGARDGGTRPTQPSVPARHLFDLATTAPPGKEVRVTGIGDTTAHRAPHGVGTMVRTGHRGAVDSAIWHAPGGRCSASRTWRPRCGCRSLRRLHRWRCRAGADGRVAPFGLHGCDGRGDRIPARDLAGRFETPGVAGGLCRVDRCRAPTRRCPDASSGDSLRARVLRLSRH